VTAPATSITDAEQLVAARARVVALVDQLGLDELAVLERVGEGLARGRAIYGELDIAADRRNFVNEGIEELRDLLVYFGAGLLKLERSRRSR